MLPDGAVVCGRCGTAVAQPQARSESQQSQSQSYAQASFEAQPGGQPAYQPAPVYGAPPQGAPAPIPLFRPALVGRGDLLGVVRDALLPLLVVLVVVFGVVVGLAWLVSSTSHGGFQDWFTSTVVLVAGALGAPAKLSVNGGADDSGFGAGGLNLNLTLDLSVSLTAWSITFLLFFLWMRSARRSESGSPSASPLQLVARSVVPALGVSLALLVLALVSSASDVFNLVGSLTGSDSGLTVPGGSDPFGNGGTDPFGSGGGGGVGGSGAAFTIGAASDSVNGLHSTIGVSPGWVFLGPLLIAFAAFLVGRLTAVARRPAGDPGGEWIRKLIAPWRGSARIAWTQLRAVGLLAGLVVLIYAEYHLLTASGASGREKVAEAIVAVLVLPNLMVGGALTGFCVTLSNGLTLGLAGSPNDEIGLFGNSRPWLIFVLIAAAVVGTLLPWFLVRTRRRVVNPAAFAPIQVWRAAVFGALAGVVAAMLGEVSMSGSSGFGSFGGSSTVGLIYSVIGAVVAGALWCAAAYLALALLVTPRAARVAAAAAGGSQPGGSSFAHSWPGAVAQPAASAAAAAGAAGPDGSGDGAPTVEPA